MRIDRMAWIPARQANLEYLRSKLSLYREDFFTGDIAGVDVIESSGGEIGLPRAWAVQNLPGPVEDATTYPSRPWPRFSPPKDFRYWEGQKDAIRDVYEHLKAGNFGCRLDSKTGSGKTNMSVAVAALLNTPTLVLVHKNDLVENWHKAAKLCWPGVKIGHVQQNQLDYKGCHLVTATAQTIYSRLGSLPPDFFKYFGLLITDEAHRYAAETFQYVLKLLYARYRLGVSATWDRSDNLGELWNWHISEKVVKTNIDHLTGTYMQIRKSVTWEEDKFRMFRKNKEGETVKKLNFQKMINAALADPEYNDWLMKLVARMVEKRNHFLIATSRVDHAKALVEKIQHHLDDVGSFKTVSPYIGEMSKEERDKARKSNIIVATYSMISEGTDIPELDAILLTTPKSSVVQIVGRIQRRVKGKKSPFVVDCFFDTPYNVHSAAKRRQQYEQLGFVKYVPPTAN